MLASVKPMLGSRVKSAADQRILQLTYVKAIPTRTPLILAPHQQANRRRLLEKATVNGEQFCTRILTKDTDRSAEAADTLNFTRMLGLEMV